jgi:hypothetical protein
MKKIILLLVIFMSALTFAQKGNGSQTNIDQFVYDENGLNPQSVSVILKDMKRDELADKVEAWANERFKKIKGKGGNKEANEKDTGKGNKTKKVKIKGFTYNAICVDLENNPDCKNVDYVINVIVEDGKYTFNPKNITYNNKTSKKKDQINLGKSDFHESNDKIKAVYQKVPSQIEDLFNKLNKSLYNYIMNFEQEDEW